MNSPTSCGVVFAITGGIGCGKSTVAGILRSLGCDVLDADDLSREMVARGSTSLRRIVEHFGEDVLLADGTLDRTVLADRVFTNGDDLRILNEIVHPLVRKRIESWVTEHRVRNSSCACVIPLLYEAGIGEGWDFVVCIAASEPVSRSRLRARGLSDVQIDQRRSAQWSIEEKKRLANHVIENDGTIDQLNEQVRAFWNQILEKESQHG